MNDLPVATTEASINLQKRLTNSKHLFNQYQEKSALFLI